MPRGNDEPGPKPRPGELGRRHLLWFLAVLGCLLIAGKIRWTYFPQKAEPQAFQVPGDIPLGEVTELTHMKLRTVGSGEVLTADSSRGRVLITSNSRDCDVPDNGNGRLQRVNTWGLGASWKLSWDSGPISVVGEDGRPITAPAEVDSCYPDSVEFR
jgi:hypothetical protein